MFLLAFCISYNLYDRAPMTSLAQSEVAEFYVHLRSLASLLRQPENEYVVRLSPGTVSLVFFFFVLPYSFFPDSLTIFYSEVVFLVTFTYHPSIRIYWIQCGSRVIT